MFRLSCRLAGDPKTRADTNPSSDANGLHLLVRASPNPKTSTMRAPNCPWAANPVPRLGAGSQRCPMGCSCYRPLPSPAALAVLRSFEIGFERVCLLASESGKVYITICYAGSYVHLGWCKLALFFKMILRQAASLFGIHSTALRTSLGFPAKGRHLALFFQISHE